MLTHSRPDFQTSSGATLVGSDAEFDAFSDAVEGSVCPTLNETRVSFRTALYCARFVARSRSSPNFAEPPASLCSSGISALSGDDHLEEG